MQDEITASLAAFREHFHDVGAEFKVRAASDFDNLVSARYAVEDGNSGESFTRDVARARYVVRVEVGGIRRKFAMMFERDPDAKTAPVSIVVDRMVAAFQRAINNGTAVGPLNPGEPTVMLCYPGPLGVPL